MIRNEAEYRKAVTRLREEKDRHADHKLRLEADNHTPEEIKRAMDPLRSFHLQLEEEVQSYERLKRGDLQELRNLHEIGRTLIGLRIALGMNQREFAGRLGVNETQVSRDERNEYHGITVERVSEILDVLGVTLRSNFEQPIPGAKPSVEDHEEVFA